MTSYLQSRNQKREALHRRAILPMPEKSKAELREELARAVRNTAAMQAQQKAKTESA